MQKRPRLTLLSIYISEFQKIGRHTSVEIMLAKKSVCRVPLVCFFLVYCCSKILIFPHSLDLLSHYQGNTGEKKFCRDSPCLSFQGLSSHIWSIKMIQEYRSHFPELEPSKLRNWEVRNNVMALPFVTRICKNNFLR